MDKFKLFLTTPVGSIVKTFLTVVLSLYLVELGKGHQLFQFDKVMWQSIVTAGVISVIPTIINILNPEYKQYGYTKAEKKIGNKISEIESAMDLRPDEPHTESDK